MRHSLDTLEPRRLMANFTVTNTLDTGPGSLRAAIASANATTAADVIAFNLPSGSTTINFSSPMDITRPVTIDATTQPGYSTSPVVRLADGGTTASALLVGPNGAGTILRGLSITGFGNPASSVDGNAIMLAATTTIEKCYIGIAPNGVAAGNEGDGVIVQSTAPSTLIQDCVISGNGGDGVQVEADYTRFVGSIIGLDPTGSFARGNSSHGINVQDGYDVQVWGQTALNVISGNAGAGLFLKGPNASGGARVFGTYFGLSKGGNAMLANGTYGIHIDGSNGHLIGNTGAGVGNRFGGNGIRIVNSDFSSTIRNNTFGIGVNPGLDVGLTYAMNLESGGHNIEDNTIGRVDIGIRMASSLNVATLNHIGITADKVAIPVQTGVSIAGDWNDVQFNTISNCGINGAVVLSGANNALRNSAWNNGQSVKINAGANSDLPKATINTITEKADGSIDVNVSVIFAVAGTRRVTVYSSDGPGNAASGDTQRFLGSVDRYMNVGVNTFTVNYPASKLLDGHFVSLAVMKIKNGGANSETGETSIAGKIVSSPAVYQTTYLRNLGNAIDVRFSSDVSASLNASDLSVTDAYNGTSYGATSVTWTAATKTARFVRTGGWPDSRYTAAIKTASVAANGKWNLGNFPTDFRVLRGDANDDGVVDFSDLLIFAQHYGTTGNSFDTGNFNYDSNGLVNFDDLLLLAQNYGRVIAHPAAAAVSIPRGIGKHENDSGSGSGDVLA